MRRTVSIAILATLSVVPAIAQVTNINSVVIQERRFNDYPNSTLVTTNNYPSEVSFNESNFGTGGFANQHVARFSENGTTARLFQNSEAFDISFNLMLDVGSTSPRKEAGIRMDTFNAGESFFIATSDGEVAAFGGPFPFFTFGSSAYTEGTTALMRLIYRPDDDADPNDGDSATMEYIFNGVSSGQLAMSNAENGIINGSDFGVYVQNQPDDNNSSDFSNASFTNFNVAVPEPATVIALAGGALALLRKRRKTS